MGWLLIIVWLGILLDRCLKSILILSLAFTFGVLVGAVRSRVMGLWSPAGRHLSTRVCYEPCHDPAAVKGWSHFPFREVVRDGSEAGVRVVFDIYG